MFLPRRSEFKTMGAFLQDFIEDVAGDMRRKLRDAYYWVAHRVWDRYDYCWTAQPPGYSDVVERMLHVNFQLLVDFVELEKPDEILDWTTDEGHIHAWNEVCVIYLWWTQERPNRHDPIDDIEPPTWKNVRLNAQQLADLHLPADHELYEMVSLATPEHQAKYDRAVKRSMELEREWADEDTDMLCRLMKIRRYLWT